MMTKTGVAKVAQGIVSAVVSWDTKKDKLLLKLLIEAVLEGKKSDNGFKKSSLEKYYSQC